MKQAIPHVTLVVRDYDEAIRFFCDKLHFRLIEDTYDMIQNSRRRFATRIRPMPREPLDAGPNMKESSAKPETVDEYLAALSKDKRDALQQLRKTLHTVIPRAQECI